MNPLVLHFLNLAQRAGNTPTGQAFLRMAQNAADQIQRGPRLVGSQSAGAGSSGPFYSGFTTNTVTPRFNPVGRGLAGVLGAGSVAAGTSNVNPAQSLFDQLDRSSTPREPRPLTIPGGSPASRFQNSDMSAGFADPPQFQNSDMSAGFADPPQFTNNNMSAAFLDGPSAARAAVRTARTPLPPPRSRDEAPARGRFFSGPDYQSRNDLAEGPERGYGAPVLQNGRINWGDSENPADFVRADAAMRAGRAEGGGLDPMGGLMPPDMATMPVDAPMPMPPMPADAAPPPSMDGPKAPAAGGGAGGRDAAINKALDIIHNLVTRQRI